ncbi:MucBP domain-containing protein [Isobaculum melis]|uniref:MucBP domain-containing protein n=1 Tax=Isobaculum melis TaxID=142588 RepID=A0A1H9PMW2_9LACT|nr:MucBP domain-containing protein [Isobaculum melis]SER49601.1 MucBP domain-containing protein [Isobaculum melis]
MSNRVSKVGKWGMLLAFCFVLLFSFGKQSQAETVPTVELKGSPVKIIEFDVKRNGGKYELENLTVIPNFPTIASVTISMPSGVKLELNTPTGWQLNNDPNDSFINYTLDAHNTPTDVQNVLKQLRLTITDEAQTKGIVTISLSDKEITAWEDENGVKHYYRYIPKRLSWAAAYNEAKSEANKYKNLTGYLATITSAAEHDHIFNAIAKEPGWLGATRMVRKDNGAKIQDEPAILTATSFYRLDQSIWYWVAGPEAGLEFYNGIIKATGLPIPGVYNGWSAGEPNNNWHNIKPETVLQFALNDGTKPTKWWNDLPNEGAETWPSSFWNEGYYIEYSAYGGQTEINDENAHSADVPQRVSIKYRDQDDALASLTPPDQESIGDVFAIGTPYDATSYEKTILGYDLVSVQGNPTGNYDKDPIEIIYYYRKQQLTFHIQQVMVHAHSQLVVPSKGYAEIRRVDAQNPTAVMTIAERINVRASSLVADANDYQKSIVIRNPPGEYYQIEGIIPEYYHSLGYVLTDKEIPHSPAAIQSGFPTIDSNGAREYWITFYLQPTTPTPLPFSWVYHETSFDEIK